jgi:hypothetical protein
MQRFELEVDIMSKIICKTYQHNGNAVDVLFTETVYFNATAAAKAFGKKVNDWTRLKETSDYIQALINSRKCYVAGIPVTEQNQLVRLFQGGKPEHQGTWLHNKLAVPFARWLNADFAVWCDEQIHELILAMNQQKSPFHPSMMQRHVQRDMQIANSKDVNAYNYEKGGRDKVISYNRKNCMIRTNKEPKEIVEFGKQQGLKSKQCGSAKEVLRRLMPEKACGMSFADTLITQGKDETKSLVLSVKAEEIFAGLLELGVTPAELLI